MKKVYIITAILCFSAAGLFAQTLGDVNTDHQINIVDALMIAQYSVGLSPADFDAIQADVDGNQAINIIDALLVAQFSVGIITTFPGAMGSVEKWLNSHPIVREAILWRDAGGTTHPYNNWLSAWKNQLQQYVDMLNHKPDLGFSVTPPLAASSNTTSMAFEESLGRDYYLGYLAQSLLCEMENLIPWSVTGYTPTQLANLFNSSQMFSTDGTYQRLSYSRGRVTPGDPGRVYAFLKANNIIGSTPLGTIENLLLWCQPRLVHFAGSFTAAVAYDHWQYEGFPPVERILSGTERISTPGRIVHFTAGCWGTVGFFRYVLRVVNLPVELKILCSHSTPIFMSVGKFLSHGDDPYNLYTRWLSKAALKTILLDMDMMDIWFGTGGSCDNIGRGPYEAVKADLPVNLLKLHCSDLAAGSDHANGQVFGGLSDHFTLEELEAENLWTRIEAKIESLGGCAALP